MVYERPVDVYESTSTTTRRTKYRTDSTNSTSISSSKVDGDFNYLIDAVNEIDAYNASGAYTDLETAVGQIKVNQDNIAGLVAGSVPDGTITTAKLATDAVTQVKMADNSVGTAEIIDANVTTAKLATNAVTTAKITDGNVTLAKLATNSVDSSKIVDLSISEGDIAVGAVTTTKIGTNAVTLGKLAREGTAGQVLTSNGAGADPSYQAPAGGADEQQLCKVWVLFDGALTVSIRDSYNVSSLTDQGVGFYDVNFTIPMAADNTYSVATSTQSPGSTEIASLNSGIFDTTYVRVRAVKSDGTTVGVYDPRYASVQIFGDQ